MTEHTDEDMHRAVKPGPMTDVYAAIRTAGLPGWQRAQVLEAWTAAASTTTDPLRRARRLIQRADACPPLLAGVADVERQLATLAVRGGDQ